ncbi:hypothetical protein AN639_06235 [Candidatus Epulonipiscium fishelsonii]|uniref:Uncharacterized protein n=1 Tax=Candidatus Epulonipiscium fishelsonii TaxID=77094 RepID=A0ACC8XAN0_9FIRM|nr:hypothetical protein AN639_06235 [Epulopiscium sp. SCG-B05WGA-EpuloA1]ONI39491.1 hypothetical protein AN396_08800 [Epulopiscium sp. SCG-B11WGA-EpuloA1]
MKKFTFVITFLLSSSVMAMVETNVYTDYNSPLSRGSDLEILIQTDSSNFGDNLSLGQIVSLDELELEIYVNDPDMMYDHSYDALDIEKEDCTALYRGDDLIEFMIAGEYTGYGSSATIGFYSNAERQSIFSTNVNLEVNEADEAGVSTEIIAPTITVLTGERQQIGFTIQNGDDYTNSSEMKLTLADEDESKGINIITDEITIPEMDPNEKKEFLATIEIGKDVMQGKHKINLELDGGMHEIWLKVDSTYIPPTLEITSENAEGFIADQPHEVKINLKNVGEVVAENLKLELMQNDKIFVLDGSNVRYVESIPPGEIVSIPVKMQVVHNPLQEEMEDRIETIPLQLKATFIDDLNEAYEDTQYIYLSTIIEKDDDKNFKEELIINNIVEPLTSIKVEEDFDIGFSVTAPDGAKNVKITVDGAEGIIPKSKNLFIVNEFKEEELQDYIVTFLATNDVVTGVHPIEINIDYVLNDEEINYSQFATIHVENEEEKIKEEITIDNIVEPTETINVGENFDIGFSVTAPDGAENVKITVNGAEGIVPKTKNLFMVNEFKENEPQDYIVKFLATDTVVTGMYLVEINLEYTLNNEEINYSQYATISIENEGETEKEEITIDNIIEPTKPIKVGEIFDVGFRVTAPDGAKNVKITVNGIEGIIPKTKNLFMINELKEAEPQNYSVKFSATDKLSTNIYPIEMNVEYSLNDKEINYSQYATISVENEEDEEEKGGKPKVIIGEYNSDPVVVQAGEEFTLNIGFLNTHKELGVYNFKANLTINEEGENNTGSVFTPVGGSNTFYIDEMDTQETVNKTIRMYTIPTAVPKTYELSISMEYEDKDGTTITATEFVGIPVEQVTKLEVADVTTEIVEVGMESELRAQIFNKGKTNISNIVISTTGEGFEVVDNKMIIGKLEQGMVEDYEPTIIPLQPGILHGQINIEYEDVTGKVNTMSQTFEMEAMEAYIEHAFDYEFVDDEPYEEEIPLEEPAIWPKVFGTSLGIGVAALITKLYAKRHFRKIEDEDEDY